MTKSPTDIAALFEAGRTKASGWASKDGVIESDVRDILERLDYASKSKTFGSDDEASMVRVSHKIIRTLSSSLAAERGAREKAEGERDEWKRRHIADNFVGEEHAKTKSVEADLRARLGVARAALEKIAREDHAGTHYRDLAQHTLRALKNMSGKGGPHELVADQLIAAANNDR